VVLRLFSPDEGDDEGRRKLKLDSEPVAQISDVSDLSDHCCCREVGVLFLRGFVWRRSGPSEGGMGKKAKGRMGERGGRIRWRAGGFAARAGKSRVV
jgi:hypothetical protein